MNKRKVRKDFDKSQPIMVNVKDCSDYIKEQVHQAFFDVGFTWKTGIQDFTSRGFINSYTNISGLKQGRWEASDTFMWSDYAIGITPEEFFAMVYEDEPQGHPHAELIMQYAEDAKTHAEPWKLWQHRYGTNREWIKCIETPRFHNSTQYRRKPKTHLVHGVEIPDLRIKPKINDRYYAVDIYKRDYFSMYVFIDDCLDSLWAERGLCYEYTEAGEQAAILHAKAMLGIVDNS